MATQAQLKVKHSLPVQLGLPLDLPVGHYDLLHHEQRGVVLHWERQGQERRQWLKLKPGDPLIHEILRADRGQEDRFISVNEFDGWRQIRLLRSLRALFVDLDDQTDAYAVLDHLAQARIPAPGLIVSSGTGLHLYWLLEPLPPQVLPVWQRCQDELIRILKPLGADSACRDCTRVLRLVGTKNRGEAVQALVLSGQRWGLRQIAFEILGTEGRGKKPQAEVRDIRAKRKTPDRAIQGSIYARWHLVYQDLLRISEHHGHRIPEGYRDKWLFLVAVSLSWFTHPQGVADEIQSLGRDHTDLDEREMRQALDPSVKRALEAAQGDRRSWNGQQVDPRYRFRRQTLYDWLGDLIPPDLLPAMRAIIPDTEARRRKAERNAIAEQTRKARDRAAEGRYATNYTKAGVRSSNEQKRDTARLMRSMGTSYPKIASELQISLDTAYRWCR
jgi:hypothetical protein